MGNTRMSADGNTIMAVLFDTEGDTYDYEYRRYDVSDPANITVESFDVDFGAIAKVALTGDPDQLWYVRDAAGPLGTAGVLVHWNLATDVHTVVNGDVWFSSENASGDGTKQVGFHIEFDWSSGQFYWEEWIYGLDGSTTAIPGNAINPTGESPSTFLSMDLATMDHFVNAPRTGNPDEVRVQTHTPNAGVIPHFLATIRDAEPHLPYHYGMDGLRAPDGRIMVQGMEPLDAPDTPNTEERDDIFVWNTDGSIDRLDLPMPAGLAYRDIKLLAGTPERFTFETTEFTWDPTRNFWDWEITGGFLYDEVSGVVRFPGVSAGGVVGNNASFDRFALSDHKVVQLAECVSAP